MQVERRQLAAAIYFYFYFTDKYLKILIIGQILPCTALLCNMQCCNAAQIFERPK
jgi:hypothetical protein